MVSQSTLDSITSRLKARLTEEIGVLEGERSLAHDQQRTKDYYAIRRKLRGRHESIMIIDGFMKALPESFEFFLYEPAPIGKKENGSLRAKFDAKARHGFLRASFQHWHVQDTLQKMGLSYGQIKRFLQIGAPLRDSERKTYDISIDHIVEIAHGGDHDESNLCVVPRYFNTYKGYFAQIQTRFLDGTEIIGIRPKPVEQLRAIVPFIPGGFRPDEPNDKILQQRMEELLGVPLRHYEPHPSA